MATLSRLSICGIRSFKPYDERAQELGFTSPVTLILGQNGCGKTTLIEAIKFACTAEVPVGTNNGQAFVHDPKISGSTSTKGQIKLKFIDPQNNEITVTRVVEVTQTNTGLKFNSKSATIKKVTPSGNETSISGRCADVTTECCQLMNVTPAILNNVIFCHQENSLWPLDEGKKLKERFDEIFDAQKYNKCTDLFRTELKNRQTNMKVLESELGHRKDKKQDVDRKREILEEKEAKCRSLEEDINLKKDEIEPIKQRINEILELERSLGDLQRQLATKEATRNGVIEEQKTIKKNLPFEFEGTDEELRSKIESFERDGQKEEQLINDLEKRKGDIENKTKMIVKAMEGAQTDLGKLNEMKSQYESKCQERCDLINKGKVKMSLQELKPFNDNAGAKAVLEDFKMELENQEMFLASLIDEKDEEEQKLQVMIDKAREKTISIKESVQSKQKESKECQSKVNQISNDLITLSTNEDLLEDSDKKIEKIDKSLCSLKLSFPESQENKKVEEFRKDIQYLESTIESLEEEYKILQQNDITEGKIESEKHLIMQKEKEINRIKSQRFDALKQLFGETVPEKNLKTLVLTMQQKTDDVSKNLTEKISKKQKEVTTLEVQRQHQEEKIAFCEKELKSNQQKISQACNGRDYDEILESTFQKKERLQIDKGQYSSVRIIYGQFIKRFEEETPCCPVCETKFQNKTSVVQKILTTLKNKLDRVPQELTRVEKDLEKEEELYNKLQQLKLLNEETKRLAKEKLPQLKEELREIKQNLNTKISELDELKAEFTEPQKISNICKNIISDVSSLDQNMEDLEKSEQTIQRLKQSLVQVASKKSKQEVEFEIDQNKSELGELRNKLDTQLKRMNKHRDRIQQLMQDKNAEIHKQMLLKENLQSKPMLEKQQTEAKEKIEKLKEEIIALQSKLSKEEDQLKDAIKNKEIITQKNKQQIQQQRSKVSDYSKIVEDLSKLQKEIDYYLNNETDKQLETIEFKLLDFRNKEKSLNEAKTKIIDAVSEKKENLAKQELRFRTLKNNVILREKKAIEIQLSSEILDLQKRIGGFNYRTVYEEKQRLEATRDNLERQINSLSGEKNGLLETIQEFRNDLNRPENKKAHANYKAKFYEVVIAKNTIKELYKYIVALEKAILKFHKARMNQINRSIRDLWRSTYRGNDIDYIEIKAEHATGSSTKRSYNYKVVQIKNGVELDFRGRCSAGQKVLACLIIRMALAETLSSNCGMLALDEPTTNLDKLNILSLCDTIARVINNRHKEKTFQLIIITHDEEFLRALKMAQGVTFYYRIERDNSGYSTISKKAL